MDLFAVKELVEQRVTFKDQEEQKRALEAEITGFKGEI
jgi:hypothetical protein